jgi:hypothetical protein
MSGRRCGVIAAGALGLVAGMLVCALLLGMQVNRHERGLWTLRFQRVLDCGLDYSGPPYTNGSINLWLTCGAEDQSWRLWPLRGD